MKRTFCLLLALVLCLSLVPAARADLLFEPDDTFFWEHRGECQHHDRSYFAQGPDNVAVVYQSPKSAAVVERVKNGDPMWIYYIYTDENGIRWGYTENYQGDYWAGWVPMDYLLLKYDHICFREEFSHRIEDTAGSLDTEAETVRFWNYPGSEDWVDIPVDPEYMPEYDQVFTDDAGRLWGCCVYYFGHKNAWLCLDDPGADYRTLYAEAPPQQVTHPVKEDIADAEPIRPAGPSMGSILAAVGTITIISGCFLILTRKKKP